MQTVAPKPYRFSVDEFLRMVQAGVPREDARLELIDGEVIEMAPIGPEHADVVDYLAELLLDLCQKQARVRVQNPVFLDRRNLPQPDIALVRRQSYRKRYPRAEDVLLLVEVADSSQQYDRWRKALLYARHGIPEYWVVSLPADSVVVYRDPTGDGYRSQEELGRDGRVAPLAFPDHELAVADLLGPLPPTE